MDKPFRAAKGSTCAGIQLVLWMALAAGPLGFAFAADRSEIVIQDPRAFPESFTSTADGTVFFGSAGKNMVYRAARGSATAQAWIQPETAGLRRVLRVFADDRAKTLWVCSIRLAGG
jgi:hypothetical protein